MNHIPIQSSFIYPVIESQHRQYGANLFVGTPLRENGDWRDYLPPEEDQKKYGVESSVCYIEAQQHTIATIEEETFEEVDNDYSSRFNALLSDGTAYGGDPLRGADSIRHDGLVRDASMPFGENIRSWDEFHSWKDVDEQAVRAEGKADILRKDRNFGVIFEKDTPVETKYIILRQTLKYSPCPVSVAAWYEEHGVYRKPFGMNDNHLVEAVYVDESYRAYVRDTYPPYLKILEPYFNFDFGMGWIVLKKPPLQGDILAKNSFCRVFKYWRDEIFA